MMHISDTCVNRTPLPIFNTKDANSYDASIEKSSLGLSPSLILYTRLANKFDVIAKPEAICGYFNFFLCSAK